MQQPREKIAAQAAPGGGPGKERGPFGHVCDAQPDDGQQPKDQECGGFRNRSGECRGQHRGGGERLADAGDRPKEVPHQDGASGSAAGALLSSQPRSGGRFGQFCLCHELGLAHGRREGQYEKTVAPVKLRQGRAAVMARRRSMLQNRSRCRRRATRRSFDRGAPGWKHRAGTSVARAQGRWIKSPSRCPPSGGQRWTNSPNERALRRESALPGHQATGFRSGNISTPFAVGCPGVPGEEIDRSHGRGVIGRRRLRPTGDDYGTKSER